MMRPSKTRWIAEEVGIRRGRAEVCVVDAGVDVVVGVQMCTRVSEWVVVVLQVSIGVGVGVGVGAVGVESG